MAKKQKVAIDFADVTYWVQVENLKPFPVTCTFAKGEWKIRMYPRDAITQESRRIIESILHNRMDDIYNNMPSDFENEVQWPELGEQNTN